MGFLKYKAKEFGIAVEEVPYEDAAEVIKKAKEP